MLEAASIHNLIRYVAQTIATWHAPADDVEASAWVGATEAMLQEHAHLDVGAFIATHLVPFLKSTTERLGRVYQRTLDFLAERAGEANADAGPSGAGPASA